MGHGSLDRDKLPLSGCPRGVAAAGVGDRCSQLVGGSLNAKQLLPPGLRLVVFLAAGPHLVAVPAGLTLKVFVPAHQRGGHRPGGDHEGFGFKRAKQQGQRKRHHDRFDRLAAESQRAADGVACPWRIDGSVLGGGPGRRGPRKTHRR